MKTNNNRGVFFLLTLLATAFSAQSVLAVQPWDTIKSIVTLDFMSQIGFQATLDPLEGIIRFFLLITLFTIFFKGAELLKLGTNASMVIAAAISIISTIFIPGTVLVAAGASYGTIISVFLLGLPIAIMVGGWFLLKEHHWVRVGIMVLTLWVLYQMQAHLTLLSTGATAAAGNSQFAGVITAVGPFIGWVIGAAWVMLVVSILSAFAHFGGASEHHPNIGGKVWDMASQKFSFTEKGKELRETRREETRLLNDLAAEEKELTTLKEAHERTITGQQRSDEILHQTPPGFRSQNDFESFKLAFKNLQDAFKAVNSAQHNWQRAERREVDEMRRLIKELISKGISDSDRKPLENAEKIILAEYINVSKAVKSAQSLFGSIDADQQNIAKAMDAFYKKNKKIAPTTAVPLPAGFAKIAASLDRDLIAMQTVLKDAVTAENVAVGTTMTLAEDIKKKWIV